MALRRLGPWAMSALVLWVALLLALPLCISVVAPTSLLKTLHVSTSMHSLLEGFCAAVAFVLFGILTFATFYKKDLPIFLFSLAFLAMGLFDALHASISAHTHRLFFVGFHTASSLLGAVLILLAVSLKVWRTALGQGAKLSHFLIVAGLCVATILGYRALMLQLAIGRNPETGFSTITYQIHNISTACYLLSAVGLLYYYRVKRYVPALIIGGMLAALAESAYLFEFSAMWDVNWWLWHFIKAAFYFGMLTTASIALAFTIRSVETSRLALARTNLKLSRTKRQLAEFNSELHARNAMIREAVACFSLDNVLHAFSLALTKIVPGSRCGIAIYVASDEVGEYNRKFRSEWGTVSIAAEPFPAQRSDAEDFEAMGAEPSGAVRLFAFPLISECIEFGAVRIEMAPPETATYRKIAAAVGEIGPLVQSSLRNFHLANEAQFRKTLSATVSKACSSLDGTRVLTLACQEILPLIHADWAWVADRSMNVVASTPDSPEIPGEILRAEHLFSAERGESPSPDAQRAMGWSGEASAAVSFPFSYNAAGHLVLIAYRNMKVEFSLASISKGELFVRQLAVAYSNAVNYRRVVDMNRELEVQREIRVRSERLATLGQLAACVAHEVRNPLGAITNCVSILGRDRNDQGTVENVLEIIRGEVARLDRLTRDFLAIGSRPSNVSVVRLDEMLDRVSRAVQQYINYERLPVQLDAQFAGEGKALLFDSDGLEIVLWNLVLNAVQAVSGSGQVRVVLRQRPDHIFLAVIDNGRGIAPDDRQIIFEPFRSTRASGAGLGLVIVSRYMSHWGGKIKLKSTVGRGSAFLMLIPLPSSARFMKQTA